MAVRVCVCTRPHPPLAHSDSSKGRSHQLFPCLPCGGQGSNCCCLNQEQNQELTSRHFGVGCGPASQSATASHACPSQENSPGWAEAKTTGGSRLGFLFPRALLGAALQKHAADEAPDDGSGVREGCCSVSVSEFLIASNVAEASAGGEWGQVADLPLGLPHPFPSAWA